MRFPPERAAEWLAEEMYLRREKRRIESRLAELDEMIAAFFPEKRNG